MRELGGRNSEGTNERIQACAREGGSGKYVVKKLGTIRRVLLVWVILPQLGVMVISGGGRGGRLVVGSLLRQQGNREGGKLRTLLFHEHLIFAWPF